MSASITPLTDNESWDQRVAPAGEFDKRVPSRKDLCKRFQEIRLTANTFLEEYNYEVICCGKRTKYVARAFHLTLTFLSLAAGILYAMDSMNYTYCNNKCPTPENLKSSVIGPGCPDILENNSSQVFCTYHVYKGIFGSLTVSCSLFLCARCDTVLHTALGVLCPLDCILSSTYRIT